MIDIMIYLFGFTALTCASVFLWRRVKAQEERVYRETRRAAARAEARRVEEDLARARRAANPSQMAAEFRAIGNHRLAGIYREEARRRATMRHWDDWGPAERDDQIAQGLLLALATQPAANAAPGPALGALLADNARNVAHEPNTMALHAMNAAPVTGGGFGGDGGTTFRTGGGFGGDDGGFSTGSSGSTYDSSPSSSNLD